MEIADFNRLVAWARCIYGAEVQRRHYYELMEKEDGSASGTNWHSFAFMASWYSALWVVVQGWRALELDDETIDELLDQWPDYRDALRQFHQATSQFSSDVLAEKLLKLIREPKHPIWVTLLHDECQRYMWESVERLPGTDDQRREIRRAIASMTGWDGGRLPQAEADRLGEFVRNGERLLGESTDQSSKQAQELREAIAEARKQAERGSAGHRQYRDSLFKKLREG